MYPAIKEWRWGTVMSVLEWLFTVEVPFRRYWDRQTWLEAVGKHDVQAQADGTQGNFTRVELDLDALDEATRSWFWSYAFMLKALQDV